MGLIDDVIDAGLKEIDKLDGQLKDAQDKAKDNTKESIQKLRDKLKEFKDKVTKWKQKPGAVKALDLLIELIDILSGELPAPVEKFVKAYLEALKTAFGTAYGSQLKKLKQNIAAGGSKGDIADPKNPTDEEVDKEIENITGSKNKDDMAYLKALWKLDRAAEKAVDEKEKK